MHQSVGAYMTSLGNYPWPAQGNSPYCLFGWLGCVGTSPAADFCPASSTGAQVGVKGYDSTDTPTNLANVPLGAWALDYTDRWNTGATNGYPLAKIDEFYKTMVPSTVMTGGRNYASVYDYFGVKLCFTDIAGSDTVASIWAKYQQRLDDLETRYPGKVIYWTMPLSPLSDQANNILREQLNANIRTKYASTGRLMDIADWESHDHQNLPCVSGTGVRYMCPDWDEDGQGHPTRAPKSGAGQAGTQWLSQHWLDAMYAVATGN
jgi:hypothetical protein